MIDQNYQNTIIAWIFFFCVFMFTDQAFSQCAGSDGSVTVCNKDADPANKTFALFPYLQDTPLAGGLWSTNDPTNFFALDRNTGILNLWEVKNSGQHEFTYTNSSCGQSAIVTINLGGYPGEDNIDGSADACGDNPAVNLHSFIGNETEGKFQDFNGIWEAITTAAAPHLDGNFFDAESAGPGIYEFTHTVPAVASCSSREVRLLLEIQRLANSGIGSDLSFCTTDDFSGFTNYDLNSLLLDEDINGTWSEGPMTDQLDDLTDNTIDIEAIRDRHTYGTFTFKYTVYPSHAVCTLNSTTVEISILPVLQGTMETVNFCAGPAEHTINITNYDDTLISDGTYTLTYELTSASGTTGDSASLVLNTDGTGSFQIDANLVSLNEMTSLNITSLGTTVCADIQVAPILFVVSNPIATVTDSCEEQDLTVSFTNIFDASSGPANGSYDISYTLTAPSGASDTYILTALAFSSGSASFTIPANEITETGDYQFDFDITNGFPLDCQIADTATITPIPQSIILNLVVDSSCDATQIDVMVDAPLLANGGYIVSYEVLSQENNTVLIDNTINFAGGTANYQIDVATLAPGNYTINVRSTQNDTTPCRIDFDFELTENFAIEGVPALPNAEAIQLFCLNSFLPSSPTLGDIEVSANGQILFYDTATDLAILPLGTILVDGEDYFISNIDPNNNCEGSDRVQVSVIFENPAAPIPINVNPAFCASENPTISSLNTSISNTGNTIWFEFESGGTPLENTVPLIDGKSYFAAIETNTQCQSTERSEVTATIYSLEPASIQFNNLSLCGLDNPTILNLRESEGDNPFEILWYDALENGVRLDDSVLLTTNTTYYAESFNPETGCINPERMAISVDLADCVPEEYGFFIPDGFSPNNDGRNDTFFIPNIEIIFPDFTLEILNRYGARLFKGDRNSPAWDGSNGSTKTPNGVYFYIIDYNKEGHTPIQGRLYLNR